MMRARFLTSPPSKGRDRQSAWRRPRGLGDLPDPTEAATYLPAAEARSPTTRTRDRWSPTSTRRDTLSRVSWNVDGLGVPGLLALTLEDGISEEEMRAFVEAHNAAIDRFGSAEYRVFCDIRQLKPLSPPCAALFEVAKQYSAAHRNFQGSAVLVSSKVIALQHQRTSVAGGVMPTELISEDEAACRAHLAKVRRA